MIAPASKIDFEHVGIGAALLRNRLNVPVNQREYAWIEKHVRDLLQDFSKAISVGKATYFLGTIVLTTNRRGVLEVVDGQQRLATTTILLAAIRDYFHEKNDNLLVSSLEGFLFDIDREARDTVPRLTLNVDDNDFFKKRILSRPGEPDRYIQPTKRSHERIQDAAMMAAAHVQDILKPQAEAHRTRLLNQWVSFIENQAQVIMLRVPDDLNAYVMFETLNDRGLRTSQSDLVKNYLFGEADDRIGEAQQKWATMSGILEGVDTDDITITYLRHFAISSYGHTREREVFEKIRDAVSGKGQAVRFLDQLAEGANDYVALMTPTHAKWNTYNPSLREHIKAMENLRVKPIRPLMLAVTRKFSQKETEKAFRLFVCWSVRWLISGGARSGLMEETYAEKAKAVTDGVITTTKELAAATVNVVPTDAEFEEAFANARVSQNYLARYYLRSLELKLKGEKEPELIPNDSQAINLEHILPENPADNWPHIDSGTAGAYWRRLGNMVLLQASKNTLIGNSPFTEKRKVLEKSAYLLTTEAGKKAQWGPAEINERQRRMAKIAVLTWPIDVR